MARLALVAGSTKKTAPQRVDAPELIDAAKNYAQSTIIIDQLFVKHPATVLGQIAIT